MVGGSDCNRSNMQQMVKNQLSCCLGNKLLCSENDSGNFVVWQFILAEHFHPWNSLPVNAGVWWWYTETTSFRERVQRIQEWVGIHHEDYTFQTGRSRTYEHSASGGTSFEKPSRHNSWFIHSTGVICENCTQHCPCTTGIQQCVCAWWVPRNVMEVHNNLCLQVLFHFFSHLTLRWLMSYIYGAPILDVSRSHTTTQHSR